MHAAGQKRDADSSAPFHAPRSACVALSTGASNFFPCEYPVDEKPAWANVSECLCINYLPHGSQLARRDQVTSATDAAIVPESLKQIAGRNRVVIEGVHPEIDCGRFPIKRVVGETVTVEADIFADGHDLLNCRLLYRSIEGEWTEVPFEALGNDRWRAEFPVSQLGEYRYTIEGWVDHVATWNADLQKRIAAGQDVTVDLQIGAGWIEDAAERPPEPIARRLLDGAALLRTGSTAIDDALIELARKYPDPRFITRYEKELAVVVDREKARFSTWYELFPRSCAPDPGRHGTFRDCEAWLPYVASMGFDVLYIPPIHPIGEVFRKGKNNSEQAAPDDVGSPWAIGGISEKGPGGHQSIHPDLGTLSDFQRLISSAKALGLEIALDIAFQCSPDHPYVTDHPEWFRARPDGAIQYAENPPKKYQDIYPFDFDTVHWRELWQELRNVMVFWVEQGVHIFRVDNPHTKALAFWEWAIADIKSNYPDVLFLAEAFTRPRIMYRLAKLGFSQSYTYFAWRNSKQELTEYFEELTDTGVAEFFRPNLWPNTPDILTDFLQTGGPPAFMIRLVLAATLGASYGIYGPAFELCEHVPREPGSEEYLNSEKYELKHWNTNTPGSLKDFITRLNHIRRENAALQRDRPLRFHPTDNPNLICYSKDRIVMVVNLDPFQRQWGFVNLDLESLDLDAARSFQAADLLTGETYTWQGPRNYVELTPGSRPAHVLRLGA